MLPHGDFTSGSTGVVTARPQSRSAPLSRPTIPACFQNNHRRLDANLMQLPRHAGIETDGCCSVTDQQTYRYHGFVAGGRYEAVGTAASGAEENALIHARAPIAAARRIRPNSPAKDGCVASDFRGHFVLRKCLSPELTHRSLNTHHCLPPNGRFHGRVDQL